MFSHHRHIDAPRYLLICSPHANDTILYARSAYDKTKELDVSLVFLSANTTFSRSYIFCSRFIDDFLGNNRDHVTVFEPLFAGILCWDKEVCRSRLEFKKDIIIGKYI
jgi:hypothetical protein